MSSVEQRRSWRKGDVERLLGLQLEAEANTEEEAYAEEITRTNERYKLNRTREGGVK